MATAIECSRRAFFQRTISSRVRVQRRLDCGGRGASQFDRVMFRDTQVRCRESVSCSRRTMVTIALVLHAGRRQWCSQAHVQSTKQIHYQSIIAEKAMVI